MIVRLLLIWKHSFLMGALMQLAFVRCSASQSFYGAVLPARDMPKTIHAYCLAYITSMQADIIAIGTEKTNQGRGFGKIILQHLIDVTEQQNVPEITLEVAADNIPARRLYDSCGFHVSGIRKDYYYRGENRCDAVIMVRQRDSAFP